MSTTSKFISLKEYIPTGSPELSHFKLNTKEIIVNNKTYLCMITFHPAYLLRQPENKKYSWTDLKEIRKKIDQLNIIL